MKKVAGVIFLLLSVVLFLNLTFAIADAKEQETKSLRGQVFKLDWAGQVVTLRFLQTEGYFSYDEVALFVPDKTDITKNGQSIGFSQLQIGDQVTAEYINTSPGPLKASTITVVSQ